MSSASCNGEESVKRDVSSVSLWLAQCGGQRGISGVE